MLKPVRSTQFKKDIKKLAKSGSKDMAKLKEIITKLINEEKLEERYKNHPLKSNWQGFFECHIEPDWLLIYRVNEKKKNLNWLDQALIQPYSDTKIGDSAEWRLLKTNKSEIVKHEYRNPKQI